MDDLIEKSAITAPYIIQAGPIDARQYFLIAEKAHYLEVDHITEAGSSLFFLAGGVKERPVGLHRRFRKRFVVVLSKNPVLQISMKEAT